MPDEPAPIATSETAVWDYLQVDRDPFFGRPADETFIRSLIVAAEHRIQQFCGVHPVDMETVPPNIEAAIRLDVAIYYFNRFAPVLPHTWDELIAPNRVWGFGGAPVEEGAP
ncbi:head-tail connector protein [Devosia sp. 63-57]|uniref:head-tail connector protein n=1 Tax=Devosia sp. 63-57 TaxID=1895751 RepID=UPI0008688915|nr:head-tail connector protein [Devosia sp. 63-57]ODT47068.1 MAG: hypothetical protein ABS74_12185 [Pelagibacterium sp. SCN 63-126]ODU88883.1 MAG: hypothetical protein ABT14_01055 [Pelagibacterium sp. SCN 63-17]OJX43222.1 MAG: hypothetical protein BGO80_17690 [Devosia sp. 63-57]